MRKIDLLILHCSASDLKEHDSIDVIDSWHRERGFLRKRIPANALNKQNKSIGYQYVITKDGSVHVGRDEDEVGSHCMHYNSNSIGICLTGNDRFSEEQFRACRELVIRLCAKYDIEVMNIVGHSVFDKNKSCPRFNVQEKILNGLYN